MKTMPKTYILRWNPAISSFKLEEYRDALNRFSNGWGGNWSVYEYNKACKGDHFYMVRVGEGNTGVVFRGLFTSDPYEDEDWAGTDKKRFYVDIEACDCADPDKPAHITMEELYKAIPDIEWDHGHSGVLLTDEQAGKLDELWKENVGDLSWPYENEEEPDPDAPFDADQDHGIHMNCIDDDLEKTINDTVALLVKKAATIICF